MPFLLLAGEPNCSKCCRVRQQLAAVLPSHSPLSSELNSNDKDLLRESEDEFDTQEPPLSKRPKTTPANNNAPLMTNASSHKLPATLNDESYSSDSDDDVPLSTLFRRKISAASDAIVLKHSVDAGHCDLNDGTGSNTNDKTPAGAPSDPIVLDDSIDEERHSPCNDDKETATEFPSRALSDDACFICGSNLKNLTTGLKGRLNHLKRCSKKHGVTARDMKLNDDSELFVSNQDDTNDTNSDWHAGAATDLALANHDSNVLYKENAMNHKPPAATKQTTMGNFFQMPVRSLNNVLLAGARRVAKSTELLKTKKDSGGSNASKGGKRKRLDYSKVLYYALLQRILNSTITDTRPFSASRFILKVLMPHVQKDPGNRFHLRWFHVCKELSYQQLLSDSFSCGSLRWHHETLERGNHLLLTRNGKPCPSKAWR